MDFIFFHLATTKWKKITVFQKGEENLMSSLCNCFSREKGVKAGAGSPHSRIWESVFFLLHDRPFLCSIHQSAFIFPPSSFWTGPSYLLSSPSLYPHTHRVITIFHCLMSSTVKQKEKAMTQEGKISCFLRDYILAPLVTSAALRIIAQVANFLNRGES